MARFTKTQNKNREQASNVDTAKDRAIQMKFQPQRGLGNQAMRRMIGSARSVHHLAQEGTVGAARPIPFLGKIQRLFGHHDISDVRTYHGSLAAKTARNLEARAYTLGDRIVFGTAPDLHTAAHEAAHVVQQRAGVNLTAGIGQSGDQYEHQAEAVAAHVVQGRSAEHLLNQRSGSANPTPGLQRYAFVGGKQLTATAKGFTSTMENMMSDTVVRDYTGLAEFVQHSAKQTDYVGNLTDGTWLRFETSGTNLLGENHTEVTLEKVCPAVGSKSFIYEPISSDVLKSGSKTKTAYETENQARFKTFGIEKEKDKKPFGAESLFPKIGYALTLAMPYFEGKKKMIDIDPSGYVGQPVQRYVKIAWGHSKDNYKDVVIMRKAKQKIPPKMDALATVHVAVVSQIDKFITSLTVDGYLEKELDKPANAPLLAPIASFAQAFSEFVVEMAAASPSSRLSAAERAKLSGAASTSAADKMKLFSEWRDFSFEDNVKAATKRGVRYAGMGLNHLKHLITLGLDKKQHPFDMTSTGKEMTAFKKLTADRTKAAVPVPKAASKKKP